MYTDSVIMLRVLYQIHLVMFINTRNYSLICDGLQVANDGLRFLQLLSVHLKYQHKDTALSPSLQMRIFVKVSFNSKACTFAALILGS
jgi:hypothetical protein